MFNQKFLLILALGLSLLLPACSARQETPQYDPLPSWNDGASKQSITGFVESVTTAGSSAFVDPADRIAVFDNDGTLWSEKPLYFQMLFVLDRVKAMAGDHPEWAEQQPFKAVLEDDDDYLRQAGEEAAVELIMATHTGMTNAEFDRSVRDWLVSARHPRSGRPYTEMVYQPMLELLDYLRANGFKTFIVSGGGIGFMRPWTEAVYGIPPDQVVGTSLGMQFENRDGQLVIARLPEVHHLNDKAGKPVGIARFIGKRPILAGGNSDGDFEMLQWTSAGDGPSLGIIIRHTDKEREWRYDRHSAVGRLDKALDAAPAYGWTVVDMARDWSAVYPPE